MKKSLFILVLAVSFACCPSARATEAAGDARGELRWGADVSGGAPFVFPDENDPSRIIGYEVEIMEAVGRRLGLTPRLVSVPWDQLVPALLRGDFDLAFNGLEITEDRRASIDFTVPYYFFSEQLTVRRGAPEAYRTLEGLRGRRVGTLSASLAQSILESDGRIAVVPYPSPVEAYRDLEIGRVDAVLMDVPIAAFYAGRNPKLENVERTVGEGVYAGGLRKESAELRAKVDAALAGMVRSGELERIYRKWGMWNDRQSKLEEAARGGGPERAKTSLWKFAPLMAKGAAMTVVLAFLSMSIAVAAGFALCVGRLYGPLPLKALCYAYVEVVRGTPLLIQLYLLYYGLPNLGVQLNAFTAAVLGLGCNYAAYEAEIYRAGLLSVPKGQEEAARSLGMTGAQTLGYVLWPQAVRTVLPPSTNDFIALFKDTSLVSIITVTELTRAYGTAATTTYRFLELGLATAMLYFLMSFPLSLWSRRMERNRRAAH